MEELISRITGAVGIDAGQAEKAVGFVLGFLQDSGGEQGQQLISAIEGASDKISSPMPGGMMGLGTSLMGVGLGMGEIGGIAKEVVAFGREKLGDETIDAMVANVPGLDQFV